MSGGGANEYKQTQERSEYSFSQRILVFEKIKVNVTLVEKMV